MSSGYLPELFQALKMLDEGVTKFATTRAINDANDKVRQLRESTIDEAQRIEGLRNVAGDLTRRLAGLGVDGQTIAAASSGIEPPKAPTIQTPFQGMIAGLNANIPAQAQQIQQISGKAMDDANQMKQYGALLKQQEKMQESQRKAGDDAVNKFAKFAKQELEAYNAAQLSTEDFADKNNLSKTLALKALIKASGDPRPSDQDMADAVPNKSLWAKTKRAYSEYLAGKPLPEDAEIIQGTVALLKKKAASLAQAKARGFASQHARRHGLDPTGLEEDILMTHMPGFASAPQSAQAPSIAPQQGNVPTWKKYQK